MLLFPFCLFAAVKSRRAGRGGGGPEQMGPEVTSTFTSRLSRIGMAICLGDGSQMSEMDDEELS